MSHTKQIVLLVLICLLTFSFSNFILNGSLNKTVNLSGELKSPPDSLSLWKISRELPFKYRVLHKATVLATYDLVSTPTNTAFFNVYRLVALALQILAVLAIYFFLSQIDLKEYAFAGGVLFSLSPPLLLAYNLPVHTREDTLAYFLLVLGLYAIQKNRVFLIAASVVLGVLCRETLLLLPFVNLFFNKKQSVVLRLIISALGFTVFLFVRWYYGFESYNHWEGLHWNLNNMSQVIGFGYITFGALWIPFFLTILKKRKIESQNILTKSALSVFLLITITTFIGGIFNEIRILYLMAPWVITVNLLYYREYKAEIVSHLQSPTFKMNARVLFPIVVVLVIIAIKLASLYASSKHDIPYKTWIITGGAQVFFSLLALPYLYQVIRKES